MPHPRSQQLVFLPAIPAGGVVVAYTSPVNVTTLVKEWRINHQGTVPAHFYVWVLKGPSIVTVWSALTVPPNAPVAEKGALLVLEPGDNFGLSSTSDGLAGFLASGMQLQGT